MKKIILKIEIGDWDGGNNGRYPILLEWNLEDEDYPIEESGGWGHGLGGARSSLSSFINSREFQELKNSSTNWVYESIQKSSKSGSTIKEIGLALALESKKHRVNIPDHLLAALVQSVKYVNA